MKWTKLTTAAMLACLAGASAAENFSATVVAGHPGVFRWVKMIDEAFVPEVQATLEGTGHAMTSDGQYGGSIAKVGDELETVESGLAEVGICQSLFDPAKLAVQNVTYYTPFVSDDPRQVSELMDMLHREDPRMTAAYGVVVFASAALPGKLYEVAPYVTRAGLGAQYAGALCANADWYASLPTEAKDALTKGAAAAAEWYVSSLEEGVATSFKVMAENGATINVASDEMRAAWVAGMDNAAKEWATALDAQGKPGTEILNLYMQTMRDAGATPLRDWDKE